MDLPKVTLRPDLSTLVVRGTDRVTWLNGLLTCDVTKAEVGKAMYGLAVTVKGRILTDVIVVVRPEEIRLVVPADRRDAIRAAFEKYLIMEDVEIEAGSDVVAMASGSLQAASSDGLLVVDYGDGPEAPGALILARSSTIVSQLTNVAPLDEALWDALRIAHAIPRFGVDFDETTYPQEASLEKRAVSFDKGCYLGQEVVCMLEMRGHVKRKLVAVTIAGEPLSRGTKLTDETGTEVGTITSAARDPNGQEVFGLAMIKLAKTAPKTTLHAGPTLVHVR